MSPDSDYRARLYDTYVSGFTGARADDAGIPTLRADIIRRLPVPQTARILDAGCGNGVLIRLLQADGFTNVTGVDLSAEQVELAHRLGTPEVIQADLLEHLAEHPEGYDCVLLVDVLEHFDKPALAPLLDAVARALAPGGSIVARVPNAESPYGGRLRYGDLTHGLAFTHHSIAQLLAAAGYEEVVVRPTPPAVHGPASAMRWALWKVVEVGRKVAIGIETGTPRGHIVSQNIVAVARRGATTSS